MTSAASLQAQQMEQSVLNANAKRRIHPGTKAADFAAGPPLVPLNEVCPVSLTLHYLKAPVSYIGLPALQSAQLDSAFQLQEHLAALHYHHTTNNTQPISRKTAALLANPPAGIDRTLWLYELCRFLIAQCNSLIVGFLFDTPPCSAATCPEMRASEWQFLCAVHDAPKSCCAIDYCCHTLDWAANVVTNPKIFPSRFVLADPAHDRGAAVKNLINVFRRLHRIFAHAWFQHRGVFWSVEGQTGLYVLFKTVCDLYDLLPAENYKLPPEAEGLEAPGQQGMADKKPTVMARPRTGDSEDDEHLQPVSRTNTRRHIRASPSTGSAVTTVVEQDEDDSGEMTSRMRDMQISAPETVEEEEGEMAEVPVIVEHSMMENPDRPNEAETKAPSVDAALSEESLVSEKSAIEKHEEDEEFSPEAETPVQATISGQPEEAEEERAEQEPSPKLEAKTDVADLPDTSIHDLAANDSLERSASGAASEPASEANPAAKADTGDGGGASNQLDEGAP
jgi:hypothetical protein